MSQNQATPIHNVFNNKSDNTEAINETNISTAQQILQKYNQLDEDNSDVQRQELNNQVERRHLDPEIQKEQRLLELERMKQEYQKQQFEQQNHIQQNNQQQQPKLNNNGILSKLNLFIKKSQEKLKDTVIVLILFIILNIDIINKLLSKYIPFISNENGITINGVIIKGLIASTIFYLISTLLIVL